jgi:hypothetical protein
MHHDCVVTADDAARPQLNVEGVSRPSFLIRDSVKEYAAILWLQACRSADNLAPLLKVRLSQVQH